MKIRLYELSDGEKICALFQKNTTYIRDTKFWIWINRVLNKESIVAVAEDNGSILAHYAVIPRQVTIGNIVLNSGIGIHAVVDKNVRDELSIFNVSSYVYEEAKRRGIDFIYGFPNSNYRLIQEKIERWIKVSLFNAYECRSLNINLTSFEKIRLQTVDLNDFSNLYILNDVIEDYHSHSMINLELSADYWLRRYALHPQNPYEILVVECYGGIGFFVTKKYEKNSVKYLHIIDFVYNNLAIPYLKTMLVCVLRKYKNEADIYSVWKGDSIFESIIKDMGFIQTGFDTFMGIKILSERAHSLKDKLSDFSDWRLVMGDSDAF